MIFLPDNFFITGKPLENNLESVSKQLGLPKRNLMQMTLEDFRICNEMSQKKSPDGISLETKIFWADPLYTEFSKFFSEEEINLYLNLVPLKTMKTYINTINPKLYPINREISRDSNQKYDKKTMQEISITTFNLEIPSEVGWTSWLYQQLLRNKFSCLENLQIEVYAKKDLEKQNIYVHFQNFQEPLYCPLLAFINKDPNIIISNHINYWEEYKKLSNSDQSQSGLDLLEAKEVKEFLAKVEL